MNLNGRPFIPPTCPIEQENGGVDLPTNFSSYAVYSVGVDASGGFKEADIFFNFKSVEDDPEGLHGSVTTEPLLVPANSELAVKAYELARNEAGTVARMGEIFCKRILECRGVINGECWALGAQALREVIEQVSDETDC